MTTILQEKLSVPKHYEGLFSRRFRLIGDSGPCRLSSALTSAEAITSVSEEEDAPGNNAASSFLFFLLWIIHLPFSPTLPSF